MIDARLLSLLPPTALAAMEFALTDAMTTQPPDDQGTADFYALMALKVQVVSQGESLWGEDYAYHASQVDDALSDIRGYIS